MSHLRDTCYIEFEESLLGSNRRDFYSPQEVNAMCARQILSKISTGQNLGRALLFFLMKDNACRLFTATNQKLQVT
jgi:hypothetical protein